MVIQSTSDLLQLYCGRIRRVRAHFVICQSCFWCASCFKAEYDFPKCPSCSYDAVDSLPIFEKEFFRMKVWHNGNLELEFGEEILQECRS